MTDENRALKVFLCHAHSDRDAVKALYARLKREGVDVWLDKEKLLPGVDWELEIRKAVREADVVVVCLSKQFNQAGFRQKEVRIALDAAMEKPEGEIFIIPARLEECDTLESLRKWHWVDLFESDGFQRLILALRIRAEKIGATLRQRKGRNVTVSHPKTEGEKETTEKVATEKEVYNKKTWKPNIFIVISLIGLIGITVTLTNTPLFERLFLPTPVLTVPLSFTPTQTKLPASTSISIPTPTQPLLSSTSCTLPLFNVPYDLSDNLLLEDIYKQVFGDTPDSNDLYAIAYYNNRKILEGYSIYNVIDPVSLYTRKNWKIYVPPREWIERYKTFPATIPLLTQTNSQKSVTISGSSILTRLSAQISKCSTEIKGVQMEQINSGNTVLGLNDLCQGKVDLFGANKEIDATMIIEHGCGGVEMERFEVARYAIMVFINENNPNADDIQKNPLTNEELTHLLTTANSWKDIRNYWSNNEAVTRYYPPLENGEFEVVENGIFPDRVIVRDDILRLNIYTDKQLLLDSVAANPNAVGIMDYDSYQNYKNKDRLLAIPINGVYVSSATTSDNDSAYPLMATLYLYAEKNAYEANEALRSFINFYLSYELDFLDDLGYLYPSKKGYLGNRDSIP